MPGTLLVLNGPNLNMLGMREPDVYGTATLSDVEKLCADAAADAGFTLDFRQSNHEGELVTWIQDASKSRVAGMIINAGAYTHTSVAIHDALRLLNCPVAEVHLTDPKKREAFRHISYIEPLAFISVCGQGPDGYRLAIEALAKKLAH
jgi:3-dehydroquinate dehydratase-2